MEATNWSQVNYIFCKKCKGFYSLNNPIDKTAKVAEFDWCEIHTRVVKTYPIPFVANSVVAVAIEEGIIPLLPQYCS